jgi:hypothetical protein
MPAPIKADCLQLPGIAHGFFTRAGGVSTGIYASLNCGLGSNDDGNAVAENRNRAARSLGASPGSVVTLHQVHSATAIVVEQAVSRERLPKADALVTRTPGLVVGALAADCAPVLFADPAAKVVAAAHAGWRGAVAGVLTATVEAMESLGAVRGRICSAVGPCIGQSAYEVGPEFEAVLLAQDPANARFFDRPAEGARARFDLPAYAAARLSKLGLAAVEVRAPCTFSSESLFSYRRSRARGEPDYGRQLSAIVVA